MTAPAAARDPGPERSTAELETRLSPESVAPEAPGNAPSATNPGPVNAWRPLVERIRAGDEEAMAELYRLFSKGIRFYICRQLGSQELDDKVHDTFLIVVQAIQRGELREPDRLMGFVRTVVRRQVASYIGDAIQARKEQLDIEAGSGIADHQANPEQNAMQRENAKIMQQVLSGISERDREILTRFYLLEQSQERICEDMQLSETQFRLLKSRAKARFGELGRRKVWPSPISFLMRRKSGGAH